MLHIVMDSCPHQNALPRLNSYPNVWFGVDQLVDEMRLWSKGDAGARAAIGHKPLFANGCFTAGC